MTWILEWSYPYDNEMNVTVWDTEENAYIAACIDIISVINDNWTYNNFSESDQKESAEKIQEFIDNGKYKSAVKYWNTCLANHDDDDHRQYWHVYDRHELSNAYQASKLKINFQSPSDDKEESVTENHSDNTAFVATECGAKCRCCNNYNEYAYADNPNGTHECYGCRSMKKIFT